MEDKPRPCKNVAFAPCDECEGCIDEREQLWLNEERF